MADEEAQMREAIAASMRDEEERRLRHAGGARSDAAVPSAPPAPPAALAADAVQQEILAAREAARRRWEAQRETTGAGDMAQATPPGPMQHANAPPATAASDDTAPRYAELHQLLREVRRANSGGAVAAAAAADREAERRRQEEADHELAVRMQRELDDEAEHARLMQEASDRHAARRVAAAERERMDNVAGSSDDDWVDVGAEDEEGGSGFGAGSLAGGALAGAALAALLAAARRQQQDPAQGEGAAAAASAGPARAPPVPPAPAAGAAAGAGGASGSAPAPENGGGGLAPWLLGVAGRGLQQYLRTWNEQSAEANASAASGSGTQPQQNAGAGTQASQQQGPLHQFFSHLQETLSADRPAAAAPNPPGAGGPARARGSGAAGGSTGATGEPGGPEGPDWAALIRRGLDVASAFGIGLTPNQMEAARRDAAASGSGTGSAAGAGSGPRMNTYRYTSPDGSSTFAFSYGSGPGGVRAQQTSSSSTTTGAAGARARASSSQQQGGQSAVGADDPFAAIFGGADPFAAGPGGPGGMPPFPFPFAGPGGPGGAQGGGDDLLPLMAQLLLAGAPTALHAWRTGGGGSFGTAAAGGAAAAAGGGRGGLPGLFSAIFGGDFGGIPMDYETLASQLHDVARPADPAVVAGLPRSTHIAAAGNADQGTCAVCQCDYSEGDRLIHLPCLHKYHEECVLPWLEGHKTCPICKAEL